MVLGLCRMFLRDPVEAEDATQQVFLSAHRALLGGSVPREAPAWLVGIARNECRHRIRARMREPLALPEVPSDLPDPLASAIRAVDLDAVWAALSGLPRRQRRALVLREFGGLSYDELGRALGVSQSAVESLLFRARQQIRSLVAGVNAAAVPLALRDDLARLIPGFDPGSTGFVARVAALPVAVKFATAAVGVGVVATGAAEFPRHHGPRSIQAQAPVSRPAVERPESLAPAAPVMVTDRSPHVRSVERRSPTRREAEHTDRHHEQPDVNREPAEAPQQEPADAEREPAQVEQSHQSHESTDDQEPEQPSGSDGLGD